nr:MAG: virulence-associated protein E [Pseudomonadota bacterium]
MYAEAIAKALDGRKSGSGWKARCPAHDDGDPSLSIDIGEGGKILVHCFAGCSQELVIQKLRDMNLWPEAASSRSQATLNKPKKNWMDQRENSERALTIWKESLPPEGSLVEIYLRSRGLQLPIPGAIRFHPKLRHPDGRFFPAMIALVCDVFGTPVAIHRTYLNHEGTGKAPLSASKLMLGPCKGGAVRLAPHTDEVMIGEGIETCLSAMAVVGKSAWAALSTSGMSAIELPQEIRKIIVLADGDDAGERAAQDCAQRWSREGRAVFIARPPRGLDFNDILTSRKGQM